jgi:hypothetical protein
LGRPAARLAGWAGKKACEAAVGPTGCAPRGLGRKEGMHRARVRGLRREMGLRAKIEGDENEISFFFRSNFYMNSMNI